MWPQDILRQLHDVIHIPASVLTELVTHGAELKMAESVRVGFVVVHNDLTEEERVIAKAIAEAIADTPKSRNKNSAHHRSEAEAVSLASRKELAAIELLLDEAADRDAADQRGMPIVGFPGVLVCACRQGLISPEAVREALLDCRKQGTHYGSALIESVYGRLKEEAR